VFAVDLASLPSLARGGAIDVGSHLPPDSTSSYDADVIQEGLVKRYNKEGRGKVSEKTWAAFFSNTSQASLVERITKLTRWKEESLPSRFVAMWRLLSSRVHKKETPADYARARRRVIISGGVLDEESCLAVAALLDEMKYPVELAPPMDRWDADVESRGGRPTGD
jgi:hypothetical protein